jgi:hypothetical protein
MTGLTTLLRDCMQGVSVAQLLDFRIMTWEYWDPGLNSV